MPISSFTFARAVRRPAAFPVLDYELLEAAYGLSDEGRAHEATIKVLEHLFPGRPVPDLASEPFIFTQGSSRVTVRLEGEEGAKELTISVPLVKLPAGGATVAALRFLLTRISGSGQLHQPRLRGDEVTLEFRDLVARLHPTKLLEALRRMPLEADNTDDWLIGQFQALPLHRADIEPLAEEELVRAGEIWRAHWDEVEELVKESQRKRSLFFLNELTAYGLYRLRFALPMCGVLGSKIDEAANVFNDSDVDPLKREASLTKCAKEMKAISVEELGKSLGHAEYAISPLQEGKTETFATYFKTGDYLKSIDKLRNTGKSLDAALALVSTFSYLLGRFSWPAPLAEELHEGLARISGKPWREAASTLYAQIEDMLKRYGKEVEDEADAEAAGATEAEDGEGYAAGDGSDDEDDDRNDGDAGASGERGAQ
jgi:hypothetical protein